MLTMRGCRGGTGVADRSGGSAARGAVGVVAPDCEAATAVSSDMTGAGPQDDATARTGLAYCDLAGALAVIIESLAPIPRLPTSDGERKAAHLIRDRLEAAGCSARVEEAPAYASYARPVGLLAGAGVVAGLLAGRPSRWARVAGTVLAAAAAAGIVDDITNGRQLARRLLMPRAATTNVVATAGDPAADKTLVILVHHDAAPSGVVFGQQVERWLAANHPEVVDAITSNPPLWWPVIAGPALVAVGSLLGRRWPRRVGMAVSAAAAAALADIALRRAVPGANDNLSGVAVAIMVAHALSRQPVSGLRVLLVSAGAEEALQQGAREFGRRYFPQLDPRRTWFLTIDTVGSGQLVLLEGEGTVRMHDYDESFKDLVAECAAECGVRLIRGLRSRNSTDGCVPLAHGFPAATLVSVDDSKLLPNYHQYSDTPANVDYRSVTGAVRLTEALIRKLARP